MFKKKKNGFTLMELLVVMSIIVILAALSLPAMLKARKNTALKRAEIDMATLASALGQVAQDTGYYCNLGALTQPTTPAFFDTGPDGYPGTADAGESDQLYEANEPKPYLDTGAIPNQYEGTETTYWKGPYVTYDASKLFDLTPTSTKGSLPTIQNSPGVTAERYQYAQDIASAHNWPAAWGYTHWDNTNIAENKDFICKQISPAASVATVACTLLDPWGHPYTIAYSDPCVRLYVFRPFWTLSPNLSLQSDINPGCYFR